MSTKIIKRGRPVTATLSKGNLLVLLREKYERKISWAKLMQEKGIVLISSHVALVRYNLSTKTVPKPSDLKRRVLATA